MWTNHQDSNPCASGKVFIMLFIIFYLFHITGPNKLIFNKKGKIILLEIIGGGVGGGGGGGYAPTTCLYHDDDICIYTGTNITKGNISCKY